MVGRTLEGRYTITARMGSGSMGTVYRAKQHAMGREVAIKILRGDRAVDDSAKARFLREARANSLLASPNTVTVFDFGQSESGEFYLAMELLEGESLGQRLSRLGRIPVPLAVDCARQTLRSLSEAHAKGIIHRDLKPDNLFFARMLTSATASSPAGDGHEEIVKVLDFGIAKMVRGGSVDSSLDVVETQAGTVFGTPRYMSPEQAQGKPLDARTDLYSLGVILYQMLTGRPPFTDTDAVVVMARHIKSVPKRPNEAVPDANIPKELEDVVMRSLSKLPEDRQASADIFAGELLAALEAQGALTSGVRASITNAAGIRVPDSLRPPPISLPPPPVSRSSGPSPGVLATISVMVILCAAVAVYYGMARRKPAPPAPEPAVTASASASPTESAPPPPPPPEPLPPPTALVETKPSAAPSASTPPPPKHKPRVKQPPASAPATNTPSPAPHPAPSPAPASSYGVFE
ncbi:MAG: serine/threonine protein kinase [Labilithrix sp.]|nr:serine/threonine protein kinase [Labilithrix sp.]MCW5813843.1 serine/threonine protein kinase [Labilithrix sp.]